jgi:hypothetical protein
MKLALDDCTRVLEEVSQVLEPLREGLQGGKVEVSWAVFRTATMENIITASVARLETFKTTLVIALVIAVGRFVSLSCLYINRIASDIDPFAIPGEWTTTTKLQ